MRIIALLIALMCGTASASAGFIPCPPSIPLYKQVRESNDERVSAIFAEVVSLAGMKDKKFALCESAEFLPGIFPVSNALDRFALVLPRAISILSDTELTGLIAHEIAHAKKPDYARSGKILELEADLLAAEWVGKDAVIAALRAMERHIHRFPKWQQDIGRHSLQYRLNALVHGLYEVY